MSEGAMATSQVKVTTTDGSAEDSGQTVSGGDSAKTVVNINICQESSLAYLVKAVAAAGQKWPRKTAPAPKTPPPPAPGPAPGRAPCPGEQKVLGGAQILLGVMCLGLGGVLFLLNDYFPMRYSGAPFWMGSLFVVSGSWCVVGERCGGRGCWVLLATFFNLASFVAGCVALATGVADVRFLGYTPYWVDDACKGGSGYGYSYGYRSWRPTGGPEETERVERCRERMRNLLNIFSGVQILLLISCVAAMGIALFCVGYGLRVLCCSLRANSEDYVAIGDPEVPPPEVPPPYEEPTKGDLAA